MLVWKKTRKVCVLGAGAAFGLFAKESPLGRMVKIDDQWMVVLSVAVALVVIGFCLLISNVLRLSPILKKYLFGR